MKNKTIFSVITTILLFATLIVSMIMVMSCDENSNTNPNNSDRNNADNNVNNSHTHKIAIVPAVEATCTASGMTEGRYCETCGAIIISQTEISKKNHDYNNDWTIDKKATCKETGIKSLHCKNCDDKINITEVPLSEHIWDNGIITKEATCTSTGSKTCTCTICGNTKKVTLSAKEHTLDKNRFCSVCNEFVHYDIILTETERASATTWSSFAEAKTLNETEDYYEFYVAYLNSMNECLKVPMSIKILLTNDDGVVVYRGVKYISTSDYATVDGVLRAVIKIYKNEMTVQNFKCGELVYTTQVSDVVNSRERTINVRGLSWILPTVPNSYSEYTSSGKKVATIKVTNITWEYSNTSSTTTCIYLDCEMTYSNTNASQRAYISYKVEDTSGMIVDSGSYLTEFMVVGDTCQVIITVFGDDLERGNTYTLILLSTT